MRSDKSASPAQISDEQFVKQKRAYAREGRITGKIFDDDLPSRTNATSRIIGLNWADARSRLESVEAQAQNYPPALPQQEEPATPRDTHGLVVMWDEDDRIFVCRIPEAEGCTGHGDTREAAIAMCEDNLHELLQWKAESIAPLLEQEEPKMDLSKVTYFVNTKDGLRISEDPYRMEYVSVQDFNVARESLTQSLTSLAAAQKEAQEWFRLYSITQDRAISAESKLSAAQQAIEELKKNQVFGKITI